MANPKNTTRPPLEIRNRKAFKDYHVHDTYEAGIALQGTEIKAIRAGEAQLDDAFVRIEKGNAILYHAHISPYALGTNVNHAPKRPRQLLLKKRELRKLGEASRIGGMSLIPLKLYLKGGWAKLSLATCIGKKLHDKRQDLKEKAELREARKFLGESRRRQGP